MNQNKRYPFSIMERTILESVFLSPYPHGRKLFSNFGINENALLFMYQNLCQFLMKFLHMGWHQQTLFFPHFAKFMNEVIRREVCGGNFRCYTNKSNLRYLLDLEKFQIPPKLINLFKTYKPWYPPTKLIKTFSLNPLGYLWSICTP